VRYLLLASDYDGTIAVQGRAAEEVLAALRRARGSGLRLVLVTGRILADLAAVFPHADLFDRVVAENGALLFRPASKDLRLLAPPPPARFEATLRARGVDPVSAGHVVVATTQAHEARLRETIGDLGIDFQISRNKGSVMALPAGVTKATGLAAALEELGVPAARVVGVGDAENDGEFLRHCGYAVAVADALPLLKARAHWVTEGGAGAGVVELVDRLLQGRLPRKGEETDRGASPP
jgi:hypothetical protein